MLRQTVQLLRVQDGHVAAEFIGATSVIGDHVMLYQGVTLPGRRGCS